MTMPINPATSVLSQLLGMSFDAAASPSISLAPWRGASEDAARSGWGFGWYPADDHAAVVIKDPFSTGNTPLSHVLTDWERFRGTQFVCHIRGAAKRSSQQDTQPFSRSFAGRPKTRLSHCWDERRTSRRTSVYQIAIHRTNRRVGSRPNAVASQ